MTITYADDEVVSIKELVHLYESVGWLIEASDPDALARAVDRSTYVVTARGEDGDLIGISRCLSDDVTVMFMQAILVNPESRRQGIGSYLARACLIKFAHVGQKVLLSDDEATLHSFLRSLDYEDLVENSVSGLRAYIQPRDLQPAAKAP